MRFYLGPHTLHLRWVKHPAEETFGVDGAQGAYIPFKKTIEVASGLKDRPSDELEIVLHELLHAVVSEHRMGLEEEEVRVLSFALTELLVRNDALWKLIVRLRDGAKRGTDIADTP